MKAADVGMIKSKVLASDKPDIIIENDGIDYTMTFITDVKTIKISFTLDQEFTADIGFDQIKNYYASFDGDTIVWQDVNDASNSVSHYVTDDGLTMTYMCNGYTAVRNFKRA